MIKRICLISVSFLLILMLSAVILTRHSHASFIANRLIDDTVFDDYTSMSASSIDTFLNGFASSCISTNHKFKAPDVTGYSPSGPSATDGFSYGNDVSAGTIIYHAARVYEVNPKVLLVTLQKEESLVTGNSGCSSLRYTSAMGFDCPDSGTTHNYSGFELYSINGAKTTSIHGTCVSHASAAGFARQIIWATWRLKRNEQRSESNVNWNVQLSNFPSTGNNWDNSDDPPACYYGPMVQQNTGRRCLTDTPTKFDGLWPIDGHNVHMDTGATASLYYYTPHLSGNEHFVNIYESWFGTTLASYLLRSTASATVYLVTDTNKYPIGSSSTLTALSPLGHVEFIDQAYLNTKTTQPLLKRLIKGPGTTIYFFDAGIKLAFNSCSLVTDYGMSCSDAAVLTQLQLDRFVNGPGMTNVMATTSNKLFNITSGQRKEALDQASLIGAGITDSANRLNESSISYLPEGVPIVKNNVLVKSRSTGNKYLFSSNTIYPVPNLLSNLNFLSSLPGGLLDQPSIDNITSTSFGGFAIDGSSHYLFDNQGKVLINNPADWSSSYTTLPSDLLNVIPTSPQTITDQKFFKTSNSSSIFTVNSLQKAPIASWTDLMFINKTPSIDTLPSYYLDSLTTIRLQFGPTRLVKSSNGATVYMVDGTDKKWIVPSFAVTHALGITNNIVTVSTPTLNQYTTQTSNLSPLVNCNSNNYIATQGMLKQLDNTLELAYGFSDGDFSVYQTDTCANFVAGSSLTEQYIKPIGQKTIYYVSGGQKNPFASLDAYITHGGTGTNTISLEPTITNLIPNGPTLN